MPIRMLSPQLANQIAAGEVVERPASVIKELIENSIDAGANRIDIEIEQGGCKCIRIRDNGCGICKEDLALALMRHATSKIAELDDLSAILSLGFRGEALASISSVSRLTLTSKTENQNEAWQVYAEGRDMQTTIKPAAHPVGTTVEVLDLFYNTPARRRFLRTDKTEFSHIDETVKRIALACPAITIQLQHNHKLVRQYRAVKDESQLEKRVASICGTSFMQNAIKLEWEHDDLKIEGWVNSQAENELQYFYVNNRIVKDRLLTHAIRQAYSNQLNSDKVAYVIFLQIDPMQVDVNVHPAKYEVRFHEARLVHDFVYQALVMAIESHQGDLVQTLSVTDSITTSLPQNRTAAGNNIFDYTHKQSKPSLSKYLKEEITGQSRSTQQENKIYQALLNHSVIPTPKPFPSVDGDSEIIQADDTQTMHKPISSALLFPERHQPLNLAVESSNIHSDKPINLGKLVTLYDGNYAVLEHNHKLQLLSLPLAELAIHKAKLLAQIGSSAENLLVPLLLVFNQSEIKLWLKYQSLLHSLNIIFKIEKQKIQLNEVPLLLRNMNWQQLLPALLDYLKQMDNSSNLHSDDIAKWLAAQLYQFNQANKPVKNWSQAQVISLLNELEQGLVASIDLDKLLQKIELQPLITSFQQIFATQIEIKET
ncbi:MAG: DNA mismatch repair endonuclease MutL [Candidatus Schmidhempelia sp.]|nr:DNA mismatch repair endonuclease MutL [Candidatus Schmidhempelia sp.]